MAAGAVIGAIGVGLSTAGTVASMAQQRSQYNTQQDLAVQSALDAEERAELALQRYNTVRESAKLVRDRQFAMLSAQRQAANLQIQQQFLNDRLNQVASEIQAQQLGAAGRQQQIAIQGQGVQQILGLQRQNIEGAGQAQAQGIGQSNAMVGQGIQTASAMRQQGTELESQRTGETTNALNQQSQVMQAQGQQFQQIGAQGTQLQQQLGANRLRRGANQSFTTTAQEGLAGLQLQGAYGQQYADYQQDRGVSGFNVQQARSALQNAQTVRGQGNQLGADYQNSFNNYAAQIRQAYEQQAQSISGLNRYGGQISNLATAMGSNAQNLANVGAASMRSNQYYNSLALATATPNQQQINAIQSRRNRQAIRGAYQSTLATGSMSALSQVIQERAQIANAYAQAAQAERPPGFGAYAGAVAQGALGAYQMGLFNFGGGGGSNTVQAPGVFGNVGQFNQPQQRYNQLQDVTGNIYG